MSSDKKEYLIAEAYDRAHNKMEQIDEDALSDYIEWQRSAPHWGYGLSLRGDLRDKLTKAGDTDRGQRGIGKRIQEDWGWKFPDVNLEVSYPMMLDDTHYVRDYYIHEVLRDVFGKKNLTREDLLSIFKNEEAYSSEVFECSALDVLAAWEYIRILYADNSIDWSRVYTVKDADKKEDNEPKLLTLRPIQQKVVENYVRATSNGRKHLLMSSCPRFGKTFTTFACAEAVNAKTMLITTAAASVRDEWRSAIEKVQNFSDWCYVDADDLDADPAIANKLVAASRKVAVFLTFQDIQGDKLKARHKNVIEIPFDMNVRDETHIGARGEAFSAKVGNNTDGSNEEEISIPENDDAVAEYDKQEIVDSYVDAHFKYDVQLDLSGTPYNILMTDEFAEDDIIAQVSYSDILHERDKWYEENPEADPWDNPYYDFPDLLSIGITFDDETSAFYRAMASSGLGNMTDIFAYDYDENGRACLKYPDLVYRFFAAIDGTEPDNGIYSFLSTSIVLERIPNFQAYMIFSRRAQVDAVVDYLDANREKFIKLKDWRFFKATSENAYLESDKLKEAIADAEKNGINTLTFTVGKAMTGVTIPQWNLGINARLSCDAQFYDQSMARMLSGYSEDVTLVGPDGEVLGSRKSMKKSQSIFVDLVPNRYLSVCAERAQRRAVSSDSEEFTPDAVGEELEYDFSVMPYVMMDNIDHLFHKVTPTDALKFLSQYNAKRSIIDQSSFVTTVNQQWQENVTTFRFLSSVVYDIKRKETDHLLDAFVNEDGDYAYLCEDDEEAVWDLSGYVIETIATREEELKHRETELQTILASAADADNDCESFLNVQEDAEKELAEIRDEQKKLTEYKKEAKEIEAEKLAQQRAMIKKLAIYVWCASYDIYDYKTLLQSMSHKYNGGHYKDCQRIAANIGLDENLLGAIYTSARASDKTELNLMCYRIHEIIHDKDLSEEAKIEALFNNFQQLGPSEFVTQTWVCDKLVAALSGEDIAAAVRDGKKLCAFADKIGEFSIALKKRMSELGYSADDIARTIACIPSSSTAYEMCRKTYDLLGLDYRNIAANYDVYDLYDMIAESKDADYSVFSDSLRKTNTGFLDSTSLEDTENKDNWDMIDFKAVVGNPPYQEGTAGRQDDKAIYHHFFNIGKELANKVVLITKAGYLYNSGKGLGNFTEEMLQDSHFSVIEYWEDAARVFPNTEIKGGVAIGCYDTEKEGTPIGFFSQYEEMNTILAKVKNFGEQTLDSIHYSNSSCKYSDLFKNIHADLIEKLSIGSRRHLVSGVFDLFPEIFLEEIPDDGYEYGTVVGRSRGQRTKRYMRRDYFAPADNFDGYKVWIPKANANGKFGEKYATVLIGCPGETSTETYFSHGNWKTIEEAQNYEKYYKTKFYRALSGTLKVTQNSSSAKIWVNVPVQNFTENSDIDWSTPISEIDQQLYKKYGLSDDEIAFIEKNVKPMV